MQSATLAKPAALAYANEPINASRTLRGHYGDVSFCAQLYGKPHNWSLSQLRRSTGETSSQELVGRIGFVAASHGCHRVYATAPELFNAKLLRQDELHTMLPLSDGAVLYCNPAKPADGTVLNPGDAGIISTGGCPVMVMAYGDRLAYAHAGRDCLFDRVRISSEGRYHDPGRSHDTVCDAILDLLEVARGRRAEVRVWIFGSIPPPLFSHPFDHPQHGWFNRQLLLYATKINRWPPECVMHTDKNLYLDLPRIIQHQLMARGIPSDKINLSQAYAGDSDLHLDGTPGAPRNLVIIARQS